MIYLSTTTL